ncbi:MAG: hypothetical protein OXG79_12405 [Chloroflexi bacterium]|nr:hypothetical protein [Chloroflexota bacterium]
MPDPFAIYEARSTSIEPLVGYADGFLDEEHERQVSVTRFPIESGAALVDHAVREPDALKITGWTSDLFPSDLSNIGATDRPAQAWAEIGRLMQERELLEVVTILGVYKDMIITRAIAPVSSRTGRGLLFTIELQEVLTAPLRRVEFEVPTPTATGPAADRVPPTPTPDFVDDDLALQGPSTYSLEWEEIDPLAGAGDVFANTVTNVWESAQQLDVGGAAAAVGEGLEEFLPALGDKIAQALGFEEPEREVVRRTIPGFDEGP